VKAVHFGAGNIGRGFVGLLLYQAGYEVVFADVAEELISKLAVAGSYDVHEVGTEPTLHRVTNFRALNSATQEDDVVAEIATADVVTTAVGAHILKFVAPVIAKGIAARAEGMAPLQVMACENAINATDVLRTEVEGQWDAAGGKGEPGQRAVFANTAVDRIVPNQEPGQGLDVTVESFYEWVIDRTPFADSVPAIPGATFVDQLGPYIERKLFTVNTGHASAAYFGFEAGLEKISEAMADQDVAEDVRAVLEETKQLLVMKHGFSNDEQEAYVQKILGRFTNPHLPDTVHRVGRAPLRKLSRNERFIGPAAELAERGIVPEALLGAIAAALRFNDPADTEAVELGRILAESTPQEATERITGLAPGHPLFDAVCGLVEERKAEGVTAPA
jgi:mannitol-1-phosphate 5-dehydrogenase